MIEREMEGGVVIIQPPDVYEQYVDHGLVGLIGFEEHVEAHELEPKVLVRPKG